MTKSIISFGLFTLLLCGCSTYATFYSKTISGANSLQNISKTHRVDLSHQNLTTTPEFIKDLPKLKMLDLSGNKALDINNTLQNLNYPNQLEILILDSLALKELPKSVLRFKNLKQLSLGYNPDLKLDKVFNLIDNLSLSFLNLKGNQIKQLPQNISNLKTLRDLNLSYNQLSDANSYTYLGKLPKLYSVWLDHNNLSVLPKTVGALNQIRFFYVDHNQLSKFPNEPSQMTRVWVIHAGYNNFEILPEELTDMKSLLMIHINNNQIAKIPPTFETKKASFKGLLLDNNQISEQEQEYAKKIFKGFFLLSFQQKEYNSKQKRQD